MKTALWPLLGLLLVGSLASAADAGEGPPHTRKRDIVYARKEGTARTYDVFVPKGKPNGAGVIHVISGGWFSAHEGINPAVASTFTKRGYTVFAVVHGSQPRYVLNEIIDDMNRAVRHIRAHAKDYGIDPERLGIVGGSAGGHLSLMQGTAGRPGNVQAKDVAERTSSRVRAVACFFPPTDFLNWGKANEPIMPHMPATIKPAFAFHSRDPKTGGFVRITDAEKIKDILRATSPITHVSKESAPALIFHGDADKLVPIQQAEVFVAKMKTAGVPCQLVVRKGQGHGWKDMGKDLEQMADWFDRHLQAVPQRGQAPATKRSPTSNAPQPEARATEGVRPVTHEPEA